MEEGAKHDQGKPRWDLLPRSLEEVVKAYTHGAGEYAPWNWRKGMAWSRLFAAAWRHITAFWWKGERYDKESGCHHLAAATFCLLSLMEYDLDGLGEDDRQYRASPSATTTV